MTDPSDQQWTDRYRPTSFNQIQGNTAAINRLKDWAEKFPADTSPRLLVGSPGTGKSVTVEVIADWLDLQMVELNASSARKKRDIKRMAGTIANRSADGERKVILLDEADSWHHASNKKPLYDALDDPDNLVFITANDEWETPSGIVTRSDKETFRLQTRSIKAKLKDIRDAEGLDLADDDLDPFAERNDLRSAINDLQSFAEADVVPDDARVMEDEDSGWDLVDRMLMGTPDRGPHDPRWAMLWLDENARRTYRGLELAYAYDALSRADTLLARAQSRGYRHWRYAGAVVDSVARLRRSEPYYDDEISRKKKEFPSWLQGEKVPRADRESSEASLYRQLDNYETGEPGLGCSFADFKARVLPRLEALDREDKYQLILEKRLDPEAYDALGVQKTEYEGWLEAENPQQGEWGGTTESASAW